MFHRRSRKRAGRMDIPYIDGRCRPMISDCVPWCSVQSHVMTDNSNPSAVNALRLRMVFFEVYTDCGGRTSGQTDLHLWWRRKCGELRIVALGLCIVYDRGFGWIWRKIRVDGGTVYRDLQYEQVIAVVLLYLNIQYNSILYCSALCTDTAAETNLHLLTLLLPYKGELNI